ncbi:MAG TPA: hypothetical protein VFU05_06175 [Cyclobacteriaceae bacterium]|nr:hypothetical protein [Cyclobacteriaceae bacterium]
MEKSIDWFTPMMTILGVIIGGLLTPLVTATIEKSRAKNLVKPELIKTIYIFFNLRKVLLEHTNMIRLTQKGVILAHQNLLVLNSNAPNRGELERQHTVLNTTLSETIERANLYFQKILEVEAQIHVLMVQVNEYYGIEKFKAIKKQIDPILNESNSSQDLLNYDQMDQNEYNNSTSILQNKIREKGKELQNQCDALIPKIFSKF